MQFLGWDKWGKNEIPVGPQCKCIDHVKRLKMEELVRYAPLHMEASQFLDKPHDACGSIVRVCQQWLDFIVW